jgi:riboflavin biosynthesis pyrimidine reductase
MNERDLTEVWPLQRPWPAPEPGHLDPLGLVYAHHPGVLRLGMVASVDGRVAGPDGSSASLNGPADHRILRLLRAQADVVLVGGATARNERYTDVPVPTGAAAGPDLAIVSRGGTIPEGLDPQRTWVVTTSQAPAASHPSLPADRVIIAGDEALDPQALIAAFAERGISKILCEGGPTLASWLLAVNAVDDICLTRSAVPGGGDQPAFPRIPTCFALTHRLEGGGFTMERWIRD